MKNIVTKKQQLGQHLLLSSSLVLLSLVSCGDKDGDDKTNATGVSAENIIADDSLAGTTVSEQVDVAVSAVAVDVTQAAAALTAVANHEKSRTCEASSGDAGTAKVTFTRQFDLTKAKENENRKTSLAFEGEASITREWSKADTAIACHETGTHAALAGVERVGLIVDITFSRTRSRELTVEFLQKDITFSRKRQFSASGTRNIEWTADATEGTTRTLSKKIISSVSRESTATDKDGATKTLKATVDIQEDAPLVVTIERDTTSGNWLSKTINSGKINAVHDNGAKFVTEFSDVKYTKAGGCLPVSGSLTGSVYAAAGDTTASRTYTLSFDATTEDGADIVFADGGKYKFAPEGCDFELESE